MEQQIGPTEKGREVITIGDRCKSVGVLSAKYVSIQTQTLCNNYTVLPCPMV